MRKLLAIFMISVIALYGILLCYADEQVSIQKDLPLAMKFETKLFQDKLGDFNKEWEVTLAEQQANLDVLGLLYYVGYTNSGSFDGRSLKRAMELKKGLSMDAPIYKSELFKGYYQLRAEELKKQYSTSWPSDGDTFARQARLEFDNYMKSAIKDETARNKLVVMLQERLMDKLVELKPVERKAVLDEIYSLRLPSNASLCNDYIYQVFEYGARIQAVNQMLEANKEQLAKLARGVAVSITAEQNGRLLLQYVDSQNMPQSLQIFNTLPDGKSFKGFTILGELYGISEGKLLFIGADNKEYTIDMNNAWGAVDIDDTGHLQLKLDGLLEANQPESGETVLPSTAQSSEDNPSAEQLKALKASYNSKASEAQAIIKELNRYSMYLELKNKGISNTFTKKFEKEKKNWKAALDSRLNRFGPGGMADFAAYIKQFVLASRSELGQTDQGRLLTARFRNSIIQFRQADDSSVWITDMLYNIKYMK
jgi:hypothetical protein